MMGWRSSPVGNPGNGRKSGLSAGGAGKTQAREIGERFFPILLETVRPGLRGDETRGELANLVKAAAQKMTADARIDLNLIEQRDLVTVLLNKLIGEISTSQAQREADVAPLAGETEPQASEEAGRAVEMTASDRGEAAGEAADEARASEQARSLLQPAMTAPQPYSAEEGGKPKLQENVEQAKVHLQPLVMERIDSSAAASMERLQLTREVDEIVSEVLTEEKIKLNQRERRELVESFLDDMLGLGPLEGLLADESITDIMVNGAKQIYVERKGKLELSDVTFRDDAHVMRVATRIVSQVGRRVDESTPLVDARLMDGSRVNIIIPPLAIDGPSISIRKFAKQKITLDVMERQRNLSPAMATVLRIAGRARLNILISGGTGSGKTTLLNALSQLIDPGERIVTIEDAAELQLQQPHVVRLETRAPNLEGEGEISMRELLKNALRMRPDRIILGEIRSSEAIDMLQAMNTGHDGSLSTIHANRPREALSRLENLIGLAGINLPAKAVRTQIASAVDLIVQVTRMRDGVRRITYISEVVGMEEDIITMQDLFWYEYQGEERGRLQGEFKSSSLRPHFTPKAEYYGLGQMLLEAL